MIISALRNCWYLCRHWKAVLLVYVNKEAKGEKTMERERNGHSILLC